MKDFFRWVFLGSNGIRAGWRLGIFFAILAAINVIIHYGLIAFHVTIPKPGTQLRPWMGIAEAVSFGFLLFAAWVMSKIERREMSAYGLPLAGVLRSKVWLGMLWGFVAISAVLLVIFAGQGFHVGGVATLGIAALEAALAWGLVFLFVGFTEEFLFRGYVLYTLTTGTNFWIATAITSLLFGAAHMQNPGENPIGIVTCVLFALMLCLTLRQTGNLWLAVGIHAGWDWGESFFYGVPDSGTTTWHALLATSFHGPVWLTGGSAGPEGSIVTVFALLAMMAIVLWRYPTPRYVTASATLIPVTTGS